MSDTELRLKKGEDRRLRAGHLWIFSNEVDVQATPLSNFNAGDCVRVMDSRGQALGLALISPNSLICARLLSRDIQAPINEKFFIQRLQTALRVRTLAYADPYYRWVYGESDGLPGVVVDRYGDVLAVQIGTVGMEQRLDLILAALDHVAKPKAVILKNNGGIRRLEGLSEYTQLAFGTLEGPVNLRENGGYFQADLLNGQKTGWFYDHRDNRRDFAALCAGRKVLDLFSYSGAWGITAARAGATQVVCVDASAAALESVRINAELNGVSDRVTTIQADVFDYLKAAREDKTHFGAIALDPPALIKRKKDLAAGVDAYRRLNQGALQLLAYDGVFASASCSHPLQRDVLHDLLRATARHVDRYLRILKTGGQGADHPVHPAMPETEYLKAFLCYVTPSL